MSALIRRDSLDIVVESGTISSLGKVCLTEVGKTLTIESVFEMLESESVVQDIG